MSEGRVPKDLSVTSMTVLKTLVARNIVSATAQTHQIKPADQTQGILIDGVLISGEDVYANTVFFNQLVPLGDEPLNLAGSAGPLWIFRDEKTLGTNGGDFPAGLMTPIWVERKFTLEESTSSDMSVMWSQPSTFTLTEGKYHVSGSFPAYEVDAHKVRFLNLSTTPNRVEACSTSEVAPQRAIIDFILTVTGTSQQFQVQHRCETTRNIDGLGHATSLGMEVYSILRIQKINT
jgi:hypothetical protein